MPNDRDRRARSRRTADTGEADRARDRRKERVLHTRISEKLAEDIYRVAEDLRVPVSNLVRNVLEDAFSMVESVTDNVGDLIENVLDEAERARDRLRRQVERNRGPQARRGQQPNVKAAAGADREPGGFAEVLGWQPLILNRGQVCAVCGRELGPGEDAVVGVGESGLMSTYLCRSCLPKRV